MKRSLDLRGRVGNLIKTMQDIPSRHRTPAMERLLTNLILAVAEYDGQPQDGDQ